VNETWKSKLKSLPSDDSHLKLQYAFAIGFELCQRRAKDRDHHHVTLVQMHDYRVENIGPIWTAGSR